MHNRSARRLLAAAVASIACTPLHAAETVAPVVVTATRTAQTADKTVAPVTVITREEIDQSSAATLPDLLAGRPGIDISSNGRFGKSTTVHVRGLGNGKVLFLVDGARISAPGTIEGAPSVEHIPAAQIERIEIVRGPRSALYGSEALGGVINVITREPTDSALEASVGYGTYDSKRAEAAVNGRSESLDYNVSVGRFETDGYDIRDDSFEDNDGYENDSVSGRVQWSATARLDLNINVLANEGITEFDNCFAPGPSGDCISDFTQETVGVGANYRVSNRWESAMRLTRNREERREIYNGSFDSEFDGATTVLSWQNDIQIGQGSLLTLGAEGTRGEVSAPDDFDEEQRSRVAAFTQWQMHSGAHNAVVGVRGIDDDKFGSHTVGNLDYGFQVVEGLRLLASAGTAFRAPSLFQLFSEFGNPDLEPEQSTSIEFGIAGQPEWGTWSIRTYRTRVRNLIEFVNNAPATFGPEDQYENIDDEVKINGLEVEASANLRGWTTSLSYSWSEPIDEGTGEVLPNRAERTFRLGLDRSFGRLRAGGSIEAQSARTGSSSINSVPGYGILNLHAGYRLSRAWRLRATVDNLFDKTYLTDGGFGTSEGFFAAGRTTFVFLDYRPGSGS